MSRTCCVRTCRELSAETILSGDPQPRTFRFPRDLTVRAKWDLFVNTANRTTNFRGNAQGLCARHFQATCFTETGKLLPNSIPTIADRFTLKAARKFRITQAMQTTDLNVINDFRNTVVQLRDTEPKNTVNEVPQMDENVVSNTCNVKLEADENIMINRSTAKTEVDENTSPNTSNLKVEADEPALGWNIMLPSYDTETHFIVDGSSPTDPITTTEAEDPLFCVQEECYEPNSSPKEVLNKTLPIESTLMASDTESDVISTQSESLISPDARQRPQRKRFCISTLSTEDFECPDRRRLNVQRVKRKLTFLKRQLKAERQKCRRVEGRLRSLETVIEGLVDKKLISREINSLLQARLKNR